MQALRYVRIVLTFAYEPRGAFQLKSNARIDTNMYKSCQ